MAFSIRRGIKKIMSPNGQVYISTFIIISSVIGWPVTAMTIAKDEPFIILSISWLALIYAGYSALVSSQADKHIREK